MFNDTVFFLLVFPAEKISKAELSLFKYSSVLFVFISHADYCLFYVFYCESYSSIFCRVFHSKIYNAFRISSKARGCIQQGRFHQ
jgi:hypothetical protein